MTDPASCEPRAAAFRSATLATLTAAAILEFFVRRAGQGLAGIRLFEDNPAFEWAHRLAASLDRAAPDALLAASTLALAAFCAGPIQGPGPGRRGVFAVLLLAGAVAFLARLLPGNPGPPRLAGAAALGAAAVWTAARGSAACLPLLGAALLSGWFLLPDSSYGSAGSAGSLFEGAGETLLFAGIHIVALLHARGSRARLLRGILVALPCALAVAAAGIAQPRLAGHAILHILTVPSGPAGASWKTGILALPVFGIALLLALGRPHRLPGLGLLLLLLSARGPDLPSLALRIAAAAILATALLDAPRARPGETGERP